MTEAHTDTQSLHPIERSILGSLTARKAEPLSSWIDIKELSRTSGLSIDQVRRGIEWLKAKKLIDVQETETLSFSLGPEGEVASRDGLPERKLVRLLSDSGGSLELRQASKSLGGEFSIALGNSKKNGWVSVEGSKISLTPKSETQEPEELLLDRIKTEGTIVAGNLSKTQLGTLSILRKRLEGFVRENHEKLMRIRLTELGAKVSSSLSATEKQIDRITPSLLQSGEWKGKSLRALDVSSPAPKVYSGRRHPMRLFMNEVRDAFVSLGFQEIRGPMVQSALWNFDALFIPQQHSAREMQDTFYLSGLKARLQEYREQIEAIKSAHEYGGDTGSTGWRYKWSEDEASRVVLRTHTTAVTISYLAENKPDEAKVFSVGRVFRNEKTNYKHNPEFYQIEGAMVGERLNLRNLIFTLSKFYSKLGFNEIKFWPTFFPYTEPSLQTMVFVKPLNRWMELGGMGVFRPEVTMPLGVKNPVLAWGLALDRLVMLRYGVSDIRQLFGPNIEWLRKLTVVQ